MTSQDRINAYMERHHLGHLFEDLMNKVLRDMPEEPMVYLLRAMYKKAGMEIPQSIRYGGLRKSTSDLPRQLSPERQSRSADVSASRDYSRPWATSPTRRTTKLKKSSNTLSKSKPEWNSDKKSNALDQFWEDPDTKKEKSAGGGVRKSFGKKSSGVLNAWAAVGMEDEGEAYTSPAGRPPRAGQRAVTDEELLAAETMRLSLRSEPKRPEAASTVTTSRHGRGPKEDAKRQRARMGQMSAERETPSDDSGVDLPSQGYNKEDDAIELLENAEDLEREGVTRIPKSGYKLSKAVRHRKNEPVVKLNINAYAMQTDLADDDDDVMSALTSQRSSPDRDEDDEEFESVSQVTGPRQPVWHRADSEGDLNPLSPNYSRQLPHHSSHKAPMYSDRTVSATAPSRYFDQSVDSTEDLAASAKTWTAEGGNRVSFDDDVLGQDSARSGVSSSGGWRLPDDSDIASVRDWNKRVKGRGDMDPKAY